MNQRRITEAEIETLSRRGCCADDWSRILVSDLFLPERIRNVRFSGAVSLGRFDGFMDTDPGSKKNPTGLYDSCIRECSIGDNATVMNVGSLAGYDLEEGTIIRNVCSIETEGESSFGNGTELDVLNEAGGRTLKIYDRLSAQIAYIMVLYRHNPDLIRKLNTMIDDYVRQRRSGRGTIGKGSRIENSSVIKNVRIGPGAVIAGSLLLEEGTVASCESDPIRIGEGVSARHFIVLSGSKIDSSAIVERCFIGQGVKMGKQYSAESSAFFANCDAFHGEGCSLFAGPYTVTHHKSTLMIAGLFSFFNAGSGTNQSNHMYKLGPVHQGILERGAKTSSFSYLLWPCRVGAFSVVVGKHYSNFDTRDFPFSYIIEKEGRSILNPAVNLFTVGTRRDSEKWIRRDRRKDPQKLDLISFSLFSPYTIGRVKRGRDIARDLYAKASKKQEFIKYGGLDIHRLMLRGCVKYYDLAVKVFIGNCLCGRLERFLAGRSGRSGSGLERKPGFEPGASTTSTTSTRPGPGIRPKPGLDEIKAALVPAPEEVQGEREGSPGGGPGGGSARDESLEGGSLAVERLSEWIDVGGLLAPAASVQKLIRAVTDGDIDNLASLAQGFAMIHSNYSAAEWSWCLDLMESISGVRLSEMTRDHFTSLLEDWRESSLKLNNMILNDAGKEFNASSKIGFGIDGGEDERERDFLAVRGGGLQDNEFVKRVQADSAQIERRAQSMLALFRKNP